MARYIDADELKGLLRLDKTIIEKPLKFQNSRISGIDKSDCETLAKLIEYIVAEIDATPTADVVEVKHGYWKQGVPYVCSVCGHSAPDETNTNEMYSCWVSPYCPHCGAKMDGGTSDGQDNAD